MNTVDKLKVKQRKKRPLHYNISGDYTPCICVKRQQRKEYNVCVSLIYLC